MKHFLVILAITALVWCGVSMSETHDYPMSLHVEMMGFDTVRYAVVRADTLVPVHVGMPGFNAAAVSLIGMHLHVELPMTAEGLNRSVAWTDVEDAFRQQLSSFGVRRLAAGRDSLRLALAERSHRTLRVSLDSAHFAFREQYGLYGEPRVTPATVTLYGPDAILAGITDIQVQPTTITDIAATASYTLRLDPQWRRHGDVRADVSEVTVYLPVEPYVERDYMVPIVVEGADTSVRMKVYPEEARVRVWVAQCDLDRVPEFRVAINYADVLASDGRLAPQLLQFPSWVRPRYVEPSEVQCVVIR